MQLIIVYRVKEENSSRKYARILHEANVSQLMFLLRASIKQRQDVNLNQVLLERSVFCGRDKDIARAINDLLITTFGHAPLFL